MGVLAQVPKFEGSITEFAIGDAHATTQTLVIALKEIEYKNINFARVQTWFKKIVYFLGNPVLQKIS